MCFVITEVGLVTNIAMIAEVGLVASIAVITEVGLVASIAVISEVGLVASIAVISEVGLVKLQTLQLQNYSINVHNSDYHPHAPHSSLVPTPQLSFSVLAEQKS